MFNSGAGISLTKVYKVLQEFQEKSKEKLWENKELMMSTKYHVMTALVFCELVMKLYTLNLRRKREFEKEAYDSMILALENHYHRNQENHAAYNEIDTMISERATSLLHKLSKRAE